MVSRFEVCSLTTSSLDLTPPDFFLWGHLAFQVYHNTLGVEDLKDAVKSAVCRLSLSMCRAAAEAMLHRAKVCLEQNGGHIELVF